MELGEINNIYLIYSLKSSKQNSWNKKRLSVIILRLIIRWEYSESSWNQVWFKYYNYRWLWMDSSLEVLCVQCGRANIVQTWRSRCLGFSLFSTLFGFRKSFFPSRLQIPHLWSEVGLASKKKKKLCDLEGSWEATSLNLLEETDTQFM